MNERPAEHPPASGSASAPPAVAALDRHVARLRAARDYRWGDPSLTAALQRTQKQAASVQRRLGRIIELWNELLPADLVEHTSVRALRGGNLHVTVDSAALVYELDRRLREGLLTELRARFTNNLHRVRFTVA